MDRTQKRVGFGRVGRNLW